MPRFYCPTLPHPRLSDAVAHLDAEEARHARRALRLQIGDAIDLFDGRGRIATGVIENWQAGATLRITSVTEVVALQPAVDLAVAMPKGGRADDMVNQLAQLGAARLTPLRTQRSSVDPRDAKLERLGRLAIEASKQSGRAHLLEITAASDLTTVLQADYDLRLAAALDGDEDAVRGALPQRLKDAVRVQVLIGPEGGWAPAEREQLVAAKCHLWKLGPHILRIETAAAAATAIVRYLSQEN